MEVIHWSATIDNTPATVVRLSDCKPSGRVVFTEIVFDAISGELMCGSRGGKNGKWRAYSANDVRSEFVQELYIAIRYLSSIGLRCMP